MWLDGIDVDHAAFAGGFVGLYHVLWELTHVVFEHPGLLHAPDDDPGECGEDVCITCSDEGRLAEVTDVLDAGRAVVRAGGRVETIQAGIVEPLAPGDLVLVHAGTAITVLHESDRVSP